MTIKGRLARLEQQRPEPPARRLPDEQARVMVGAILEAAHAGGLGWSENDWARANRIKEIMAGATARQEAINV